MLGSGEENDLAQFSAKFLGLALSLKGKKKRLGGSKRFFVFLSGCQGG